MKLYYHHRLTGIVNFGDELNPWLWSRLLPGALDDDAREIFVGIGTLLNDRLPPCESLRVFSSGVGYGNAVPKVDPRWKIYCLRGPLSARALGVAPELAVTDGALLVRKFVSPGAAKKFPYSFMPHYAHALVDGPGWKDICEDMGIHYIDARRPVEEVMQAIDQTEVLLAGAMHGAIIADLLRVPWISVRSHADVLPFKWQDWCASVELEFRPCRVLPIWNLPQPSSALQRWRQSVKRIPARLMLARIVRRGRPCLSAERTQQRLLERLEEKLERLRNDLSALIS